MLQKDVRIGVFKIISGILLLRLQEHIAVNYTLAIEIEVIHILDSLHIHGEPLEPVSQLRADGIAIETANLLEVSELAHFHAITPNFPAQSPRAQGGALPVIFNEANVVGHGINADGHEAFQIQLLTL